MNWWDLGWGLVVLGCAYLVLPRRLRQVREAIERFVGLRN